MSLIGLTILMGYLSHRWSLLPCSCTVGEARCTTANQILSQRMTFTIIICLHINRWRLVIFGTWRFIFTSPSGRCPFNPEDFCMLGSGNRRRQIMNQIQGVHHLTLKNTTVLSVLRICCAVYSAKESHSHETPSQYWSSESKQFRIRFDQIIKGQRQKRSRARWRHHHVHLLQRGHGSHGRQMHVRSLAQELYNQKPIGFRIMQHLLQLLLKMAKINGNYIHVFLSERWPRRRSSLCSKGNAGAGVNL